MMQGAYAACWLFGSHKLVSEMWFNVAMNKDNRLSPDTTPEAEALYFQLLRKKSGAQRLKMASQMNTTVRTLAMSGLRERYPSEDETQLKIRLAELLYGADIAAQIAVRLRERHSA